MIRTVAIVSILLLGLDAAQALPLTARAGIAQPVPTLVTAQEGEEREPGPADLQEAIEIAVKRYGGQAADADTVVRDGRRVHEVKVLSDEGIVRTVRIDPDTGAIIPPRR